MVSRVQKIQWKVLERVYKARLTNSINNEKNYNSFVIFLGTKRVSECERKTPVNF